MWGTGGWGTESPPRQGTQHKSQSQTPGPGHEGKDPASRPGSPAPGKPEQPRQIKKVFSPTGEVYSAAPTPMVMALSGGGRKEAGKEVLLGRDVVPTVGMKVRGLLGVLVVRGARTQQLLQLRWGRWHLRSECSRTLGASRPRQRLCAVS